MKTYKFIITIIILILFIVPLFSNSWAGEADNNYIKVGIKNGSSAVESCIIKSDQGFILGTADDSGFKEGMPLPAYTTIVASMEHGSIVIRDENGTLLSSDVGASGCLMPTDYQNDGIIKLGDTPYRGGLILLENGNGKITVINYLSLEHYIYGVLNAELYHTNPMEALKAQAVAARSFGQVSRGTHKGAGFDVCSTTHCQVYKGFSCEYAETNQAVDETRGEMICSDGKPVTAFYFKNSGGHTQNVEDVWYFSQPYLKAVMDEFSPSYPWTITLTFDTLRQKLEEADYSPGNIKSVVIKSRNESGSVSNIEIVGSESTINLQKEKIRNILGFTIVKSLMFSFGDADVNPLNNSIILASNGKSTVPLNSDVYIISGSGQITKQQTVSLYGFSGGNSVKLQGSTAFPADKIVTGGTVTFHGFGYGHGIGMPQDSAVEMAKQGFTYDEILHKYYTNIEIK